MCSNSLPFKASSSVALTDMLKRDVLVAWRHLLLLGTSGWVTAVMEPWPGLHMHSRLSRMGYAEKIIAHRGRFCMIDPKRVWSLGVMAVLCGGLSACTSLPQTSRTSAIHDIKITEKLASDSLVVRPGDEIRWVNLRKDSARVDIPNLESEDLACQRGFSNWMGLLRETAELKANETASLCFKKPLIINYNVRAETALGGGLLLLPGTVRIDNAMPR